MSNINETIAEVLRLEAVASGRKVWEARMVCPSGGWSDDDECIDSDGWWIDGPEWLDYEDSSFFCQADADLVAYYRTAAPALAREVQRLQAEVERLRPRPSFCVQCLYDLDGSDCCPECGAEVQAIRALEVSHD